MSIGLQSSVTEIFSSYTLQFGPDSGSLIDFETTGFALEDADQEILTLGYLEADKLVVVQRSTQDKTPFYGHIARIIQDLPRPFYTYNSDFEKSLIRTELCIDVNDDDFVDIMAPWREKAEQEGLKWPRLDELISEPEDYFYGSFKIKSSDIPGLWMRYVSSGSRYLLGMIMQHCFSDVLREALLLGKYTLLARRFA